MSNSKNLPKIENTSNSKNEGEQLLVASHMPCGFLTQLFQGGGKRRLASLAAWLVMTMQEGHRRLTAMLRDGQGLASLLSPVSPDSKLYKL